MKKLFLALGAFILMFIVAFFAHAIFVTTTIDGPGLDHESKVWVDNLAPQILKSWDPNIIIKNASPQWLQSVSEAETKEASESISKEFGTLTKYGTSTGESGIHVNNFTTTLTAEYVIEADFTKGHAKVFFQGIKVQNEWKLLTLRVDRNPNLRWEGATLTTQPPLKNPGDSETVGGVHEIRLLNW